MLSNEALKNFWTISRIKWKNKLEKISFINLFGYKEEKIIFQDFTSGKIEENGRK